MRHLYLVEQNHVFQLRRITDHRLFSHNGTASDKSALSDLRLFIDDARTSQIGGIKHRG